MILPLRCNIPSYDCVPVNDDVIPIVIHDSDDTVEGQSTNVSGGCAWMNVMSRREERKRRMICIDRITERKIEENKCDDVM